MHNSMKCKMCLNRKNIQHQVRVRCNRSHAPCLISPSSPPMETNGCYTNDNDKKASASQQFNISGIDLFRRKLSTKFCYRNRIGFRWQSVTQISKHNKTNNRNRNREKKNKTKMENAHVSHVGKCHIIVKLRLWCLVFFLFSCPHSIARRLCVGAAIICLMARRIGK